MRTAALVLSLLALAAAGCGSSSAPTGQTAPAAGIVPDVGGDVSRAELTAAGLNLTTWYGQHATYAGAATGLPNVTVAHADATSWCVQDASAHLEGPGGAVAPGACP